MSASDHLGRQFGEWAPNPATKHVAELNGGHIPTRRYGKGGSAPDLYAAMGVVHNSVDFHPMNEDGMTVIERDGRSDGRAAAWQSRAELN